MRMISGGKWAPLKLLAIVVLPHDVLWVMEGDHTANGLKYNFATKPLIDLIEQGSDKLHGDHTALLSWEGCHREQRGGVV
jgi:hypothetical protein